MSPLVQWGPIAPDDGPVDGRTLSGMPNRDYVVVVTDPDAEWRSAYMTVQASSRDEAKTRARGQLAITKRDSWSIEICVEAR